MKEFRKSASIDASKVMGANQILFRKLGPSWAKDLRNVHLVDLILTRSAGACPSDWTDQEKAIVYSLTRRVPYIVREEVRRPSELADDPLEDG